MKKRPRDSRWDWEGEWKPFRGGWALYAVIPVIVLIVAGALFLGYRPRHLGTVQCEGGATSGIADSWIMPDGHLHAITPSGKAVDLYGNWSCVSTPELQGAPDPAL